jgi:hypothetical protein
LINGMTLVGSQLSCITILYCILEHFEFVWLFLSNM